MPSLGGGAKKQKESEMEKTISDIAWKKWSRYKDKYVPAENRFIQKMQGAGGKDDIERMTGEAVLAARRGRPVGGDPNQGGLDMMDQQGLVDASIAASAGGQGEVDASQQKVRGLQAVTDLGRGLESEAIGGMTREAYQQEQNARSLALADAREQQAMHGAIGTVGGAAVGRGLNEGWFGDDAKNKWRGLS